MWIFTLAGWHITVKLFAMNSAGPVKFLLLCSSSSSSNNNNNNNKSPCKFVSL
jgi:hypothetical protein